MKPFIALRRDTGSPTCFTSSSNRPAYIDAPFQRILLSRTVRERGGPSSEVPARPLFPVIRCVASKGHDLLRPASDFARDHPVRVEKEAHGSREDPVLLRYFPPRLDGDGEWDPALLALAPV